MIDKLTLQNFTVFEDLEIDFSSKINLIIGENGTGKTHLLKAAYAMCVGNASPVDRAPPAGGKGLQSSLTEKLLRVFQPLDDRLGKLRSQGATDMALIQADFAFGPGLAASFHANSTTVSIEEHRGDGLAGKQPVFLPTKEVVSFMKGFASLYERYELSFDETYQDICLALELPALRLEKLPPKSKWAMDEIRAICQGRFLFHGGGKVTFKNKSGEYSANIMAEGFRKLGILARLLETGVVQPGVSGPLFWDEPEANLNPKLTKLLVKILIELTRQGQQVVIATHDYFVLKCFQSEADNSRGDQVRYHTLYRDTVSGEIAVSSTDDYFSIEPNPIDETFEELINTEIDQSIGNLGR